MKFRWDQFLMYSGARGKTEHHSNTGGHSHVATNHHSKARGGARLHGSGGPSGERDYPLTSLDLPHAADDVANSVFSGTNHSQASVVIFTNNAMNNPFDNLFGPGGQPARRSGVFKATKDDQGNCIYEAVQG